MRIKSQIRRNVEYQCNKCLKTRVLFIAPALQSDSVSSHGYIELVDVHPCLNEKTQAVKLFVDKNYAVRSQVTLDSTSKSNESSFSDISGLSIPTPKKADFITYDVIPTKDFGAFNLKSLKINDTLRERIFILGSWLDDFIEIKAKSSLNFIELKAMVSKKMSSEIVKIWLQKLANILETLVSLDEKMLNFLGIYLDNMMETRPTEKELLELDLLLNSSVAIPHSSKEHLEIFEEHWKEIFSHKGTAFYRIYKAIMNTCLHNEIKTILDIYEAVKNNITEMQVFPYFLSILRDLVEFGLINIERLEFYTIS